jgi:hypothetical protein
LPLGQLSDLTLDPAEARLIAISDVRDLHVERWLTTLRNSITPPH